MVIPNLSQRTVHCVFALNEEGLDGPRETVHWAITLRLRRLLKAQVENIWKAEQWRFRTPGATHYELFFEDIDIDGQGMVTLGGPVDNSERPTTRPAQSRDKIDRDKKTLEVSGSFVLAFLIIDDCFIDHHL